MKMTVPILALMALGVAACGQSGPSEPAAADAAGKAAVASPETASPEAAPSLPAVDEAGARRFLQGDGILTSVDFDKDGVATVEGVVSGETAPVYVAPVAKGQTLKVRMETASSNLYFNVSDSADDSGAALFRGEVEGAEASLTADRDMTYVITPFQPRATARRGASGDFSLTITRQ